MSLGVGVGSQFPLEFAHNISWTVSTAYQNAVETGVMSSWIVGAREKACKIQGGVYPESIQISIFLTPIQKE